jgi:hypothetical protein
MQRVVKNEKISKRKENLTNKQLEGFQICGLQEQGRWSEGACEAIYIFILKYVRLSAKGLKRKEGQESRIDSEVHSEGTVPPHFGYR